MSYPGHNGGPPLVEEDEAGNIRMRYVRFHISDFLNGIRKLPLDARGFYVTGLLCMYDNMGNLPVDDRMAALQMGCDLKTYRRFRAMMLDPKAFGDGRTRWTKSDEGFSQDRVQSEISEYCREFKNRRDAALKREEDKRRHKHAQSVGDTSTRDEGTSKQTLGPPKLPEMAASRGDMIDEKSRHLSKNASDFNSCDTTAVPQPYHSDDQSQTRYPLSPKHKPIEVSEEKRQEDSSAAAETPVEVASTEQPDNDGDRRSDIDFLPLTALVVAEPVDDRPRDVCPPTPSVPAVIPSRATVVEMVAPGEVIAPGRQSSNDALVAFERYNELAMRIGLPLARSLTPQRRKALDARLREHGGLPAWDQILANVERSAFLRGLSGSRPGWRADFDFLLQAKSCAKCFDGGYGNGAHAGGDGGAVGESRFDRRLRMAEAAAERMGIETGVKP